MEKIQSIAIVGRGAIGVIYGSLLMKKMGYKHVAFLCDAKRKARYEKQDVLFNGQPMHFQYITQGDDFYPDLIIVATKYVKIKQTIEEIRPFVHESTVIISTMNGIESEDDLREAFGRYHVIRTIAQKMSSVYHNNQVTAHPLGELVIGAEDRHDLANLARLEEVFDYAEIPYLLSTDIKRDAYSKLMINCGVNQTCAAYHLTYGDLQKEGKYRDMVIATMREVAKVAAFEDIRLTEEDITAWMKALDAVDPQGMPSMAQDVLENRPTEIGLFAGMIVPLAHKYKVKVPYNENFLAMLGN